jgi:hypothetical protein
MPRASATRAPVDSALATLAGRAPMTPPLVWLKAPAVDSAPGDAPAGTRSTGIRAVESPAGAPRPASLAAGAVPNTQVQEIAREARRALALDPSFTERLADDVLRKVDKRLRIERERRGL